jgi:hypothetical protein
MYERTASRRRRAERYDTKRWRRKAERVDVREKGCRVDEEGRPQL